MTTGVDRENKIMYRRFFLFLLLFVCMNSLSMIDEESSGGQQFKTPPTPPSLSTTTPPKIAPPTKKNLNMLNIQNYVKNYEKDRNVLEKSWNPVIKNFVNNPEEIEKAKINSIYQKDNNKFIQIVLDWQNQEQFFLEGKQSELILNFRKFLYTSLYKNNQSSTKEAIYSEAEKIDNPKLLQRYTINIFKTIINNDTLEDDFSDYVSDLNKKNPKISTKQEFYNFMSLLNNLHQKDNTLYEKTIQVITAIDTQINATTLKNSIKIFETDLANKAKRKIEKQKILAIKKRNKLIITRILQFLGLGALGVTSYFVIQKFNIQQKLKNIFQ